MTEFKLSTTIANIATYSVFHY